MAHRPEEPHAVAFIDGQNLFHGAREAFGTTFPDFDARALALEVCGLGGWKLVQVRFYTGIHDPNREPRKYAFWHNKLAAMRRDGIVCFTPMLRYRNRIVKEDDGTAQTRLTGMEKGVDVRIALDIVRMARQRELDVAVIFSQDQDLVEAVRELRAIARDQDRWIKAVSAFPASEYSRNRRGINETDWIRISRQVYERCWDPNDYRSTNWR